MDPIVITVLVCVVGFPICVALLIWSRVSSRRRSAQARESHELQVARLEGQSRELTDKLKALINRFQSVINEDAELERVRSYVRDAAEELHGLKVQYKEKREIYDRLASEVAIFDERLAFAELGVYEPHFDYTDSEQYKREVERIREKAKRMISDKDAVFCTKGWSVDGSVAKGKTMTNRNIRLTLRAFNNECEAAIANARWNNVNAMEKRINTAREQIERLNESNAIYINDEFVALKLRELYLTHEYREKLKAEKEERAERARAARDEMRLQRDMERAEEEEIRYQRLLDRAKAEAASVVGPQMEAFNAQIRMLEADLAEAHARFERAQAMAERTRTGYVYIISNFGSFGEDVVKIGLTRRLDPADRVTELGDASVPFSFDTHAIIYSEDAPALERALHREFEHARINTENYRKEFFRISIDEVEAAVKILAPSAPFFKDIEAQQYRETLARRNAQLAKLVMPEVEPFPAEI